MLPNDAPIATATPMRIARAKIAKAGRKFALFGGYRTTPINRCKATTLELMVRFPPQ